MIHAKKGFTVIELTLSLVFISIMLLGIAITIIQVAGMYNKGLTVKSVTLAGSDLASDLQRSIASSTPFDIAGTSSKYRFDTFGGRLCLDRYSYIWNYGKSINQNTYSNKYSSGGSIIRFIKVPDAGASYCVLPLGNINPSGAVDLLSVGDRKLAVQQFSIDSSGSAIDVLSNNRLYNVTFTIGTNEASALNSDYLSCKDLGVTGADPTYCSIQKFNFSVVAGNLYAK